MSLTSTGVEPPGPRGVGRALIIGGALVAVAFVGSAYGAARTEDGVKEKAARDAAAATSTPTSGVPKGPPKVRPVPPGAKIEGDTPCPNPDGSSARTDTFAKPPPTCIDPARRYNATITTTAGAVVVGLDTTRPAAVNNFVVLARYHYYDGSAIFLTEPRVDGLVAGNPKGQSLGDPGPGYSVSDKPANAPVDPATGQPQGVFTYAPGDVAMLPVDAPYTMGSAFFFTIGPNAQQLNADGIYIPLGKVVQGLDVLQKIMRTHVPCSPADPDCQGGGPDPAVTISSITIEES